MEKEFTELLYQNQGIVHKICSLYFNNRSDKDDYKQELIIQLWKAYPSFSNQSKFSTWMYRVCLNAAIDILRKEKTEPKLVEFNSQNVNAITESNFETSDNKEKLYQAINNLSDIDKAIITLYLDEFSYKEIAEIIGISESNTGVKINRIKSLILKSIENGIK
jgi:RNA polymerase sigma-70 factor (ECF subfamily)